MALEVWPVGVFVVFVMMWLRRRRAARQRERMVEGLAAKVRLLRFAAAQAEQRAFFPFPFSLVSATAHGYRAHAAKDCLGQAKEPHLLASSCHELERNRMETKFQGE